VVTNAGASVIALGAITASSNFSIRTDSCSASLGPGAQCTIGVAFNPSLAGALSGNLSIPSAGVNYVVPSTGLGSILATISASSNTAVVGQSISIKWSSSPGSTCTSSDGTLNPAFNGSISISGTVTLTEKAAGTAYYGLHCTAPGVPEVDPVAQVTWTWPPVTVSISASPTTIAAGEAVTLTWSSSSATTCSATGGGQSDSWPGKKAISGNQVVTESFAPAAGTATLIYTLTCTSSTSGLTSHASAQVTENTPSSSSGGGGGLDWLSVAGLAGLFALRGCRLRELRASDPY